MNILDPEANGATFWPMFGLPLMVLLMALSASVASSEDDANRACDRAGMETVYSSVSHGKYSETFYMCRDGAGLIHALPESLE